MRPASLALLLLKWKVICAILLDDTSRALVVEFTRRSATSSAVILHCLQTDGISPAKFLSLHGVMSQHFHVSQPVDIERVLNGTHHLSIVLDLFCSPSPLLMKQAAEAGFVGLRQHWLLFAPNTSFLEDVLCGLLTMNSDVLVADGDRPSKVRDVYRTGDEEPLFWTTPRSWSPGETLAPSPSRNNLQGAVLKTIIVEAYDKWSHLYDMNYKHLNTRGKTHYIFTRLVSQRLNFSMNESIIDSWGYFKDPTTGLYPGLLGMLQRGDAEIGATTLIMKPERMDGADYTAETGRFCPMFVFRQPSLSSVENIYTLPFSRGVWATYLSTALDLTGILVAMQRFMGKYVSSPDNEPLPMWRDVIFRTFGIICDEGYPEDPDTLSSRIVLLFMLILSVFHLTAYSACVVSLLQTPSSGFNNLHELVESPMTLQMHDAFYNYKYINETDDVDVQNLYKKRLYTVPKSQAFLSMEEGIKNVRKGMHAFHVDSGAFKFVMETFLEHEKCDLRAINVFPIQMLSIPVKKKSPYKEVITRAVRWLRETGLIDRELKRWMYSQPKCTSRGTYFVSVSLMEFYPLLVVLFGGMGSAVILLISEIVGFRKECAQFCRNKRTYHA